MSQQHSVVLRTHQLSVGFPDSPLPLLENLNLTVKAGELICFMGPNGIGKSTLIRTLASLQKPVSGEIKIIDEDAAGLHKKIAVVLTDKVTPANISVYEFVAFGRYPYLDWTIRLRDEDKKIITESIERVNVQHLISKKIYQLSDGQLQMVMIARALAQDTPIILLDEPTAHLDLNNRVEIMKLLRDLARQMNKAILISTHELDLALQTADIIWLAGRERNLIIDIPEDLVLNGTFDEVFQFKGFDLKTGKVQHEIHKREPIQLTGEGYTYLWTKNALERSGYEVTLLNQQCSITVVSNSQWNVKRNDQTQSFNSIQHVLQFLETH